MPKDGSSHLKRLLRHLDLERLDDDLFLGDPGSGGGPTQRLFGGLVAAQSVVAAHRTVVGDGALHSLHAYFLRPGKYEVPIRFVVYRIRDGRTFTTRDVVAYQSGEAIFNLSCSFAVPEDGISHQEPMPTVPAPEGLPDWDAAHGIEEGDGRETPPWIRNSAIEIRTIEADDLETSGTAPHRQVWMRVKGQLPEDPAVHAAVLTFASDRGLLGTVRRAHGIGRRTQSVASLDHAMWFHRQPRFDDWLLYTSDSPAAHAARALIFGQIYSPDGARVASVAQEGLVRVPRE